MGQKIVVVGGVACGPKAAARARRRDPSAEITVIERGPFVSYAGCGLPYYLGGVVEELPALMTTSYGTVRDALFFGKVKNIKVLARTEALKIDRSGKRVLVQSLETGEQKEVPYDKLVLATGAAPVRPRFPGIDLENVFTLRRPDDAQELRRKVEAGEADRVCIIGAGRVGLEAAEAFSNQAVDVTIVDIADQVLPGMLDSEMAALVAHALRQEKVVLYLNEKVKELAGEDGKVTKVITDKREIETDAVLVAVGVRPETRLAEEAGLELGETGAIAVDEHLRTSDPDIFAGGDCVENTHLITGEKVWTPLGSTANRHGRVIGDNLTGGDSRFKGVLGTGVLRTLGINAGRTGLTETEARKKGIEPITCLAPSGDRSHFYPGGKSIVIKLVADKNTSRLLGAQVVGAGDIVRRLDTAVAAISMKATIDELAEMDLCYAPPFGTAIEAIAHAANIVRNKREGLARAVSPAQAAKLLASDEELVVIDVRSPKELETMGKLEHPRWMNITMEELRERAQELPRDKRYLLMCQVGVRSYEASCALLGMGFKDVVWLEGGFSVWSRVSDAVGSSS